MTDSVAIFIRGERDVEVRFDEFPQRLHAKLLERITSLTELMEARVRAAVPRRTGKLESEIFSIVVDKPERITGGVSFDAEFAKAGALEYGAHRPFERKAHSMRLDHLFAQRLAAPLNVLVKAFEATPNIAEHRFLRGADPENSLEGIAQAVQATINESFGDTP